MIVFFLHYISPAVYRVHWLKAKARRDRWAEEFTLISSEMDWVTLFFKNKAKAWLRLEATPSGSENEQDVRGKVCYAAKQAEFWSSLADEAASKFSLFKGR